MRRNAGGRIGRLNPILSNLRRTGDCLGNDIDVPRIEVLFVDAEKADQSFCPLGHHARFAAALKMAESDLFETFALTFSNDLFTGDADVRLAPIERT